MASHSGSMLDTLPRVRPVIELMCPKCGSFRLHESSSHVSEESMALCKDADLATHTYNDQ